MTIFKVSYFGEPGDPSACTGFSFHSTLDDATCAAEKACVPYLVRGEIVQRQASLESFDLELTPDDVLAALNQHASHPKPRLSFPLDRFPSGK